MDPWQMEEVVVWGTREAIGGDPPVGTVVVSVNADGLPGKGEIIFQSFYV